MKTYLEKMANENLLFDQHKAEIILNFENRRGKRPSDTITKRNVMIKLAAAFLKKNGIENYSPVVISIFTKLGFEGLSISSIREAVSQPF